LVISFEEFCKIVSEFQQVKKKSPKKLSIRRH
jgi:hypothetical protein